MQMKYLIEMKFRKNYQKELCTLVHSADDYSRRYTETSNANLLIEYHKVVERIKRLKEWILYNEKNK
jgi:hypothetical protein